MHDDGDWDDETSKAIADFLWLSELGGWPALILAFIAVSLLLYHYFGT